MTDREYTDFIQNKLSIHHAVGIDAAGFNNDHLFDHQSALTKWALRKGRSAIFADTGLGKTRIQLVWGNEVYKNSGGYGLILAPLAVAEQTVHEGSQIGIAVNHARDDADIQPGINITNYDRLHRFDTLRFNFVVLDESSIIKHHDSKTLKLLLEAFSHCPYRLCATATPAPNDWTELGTHAEFLGICSRAEMLSEYFIHDAAKTQDWRLKGHAKNDYWKWVCSWGAMIRSPADLGFDDSAYQLPPLNIEQVSVESNAVPEFGSLFALEAQTLTERRQARRDSMSYRVNACADRANASDDPWIIWCELNAEGEALRHAIPGAVEIKGADKVQHKEQALSDFAQGKIRVLITKPKIAGFGLNWQHCHNVAFVGVSDSWEAYYQAVRRCWRFGQDQTVNVYLFVSEQEGAVKKNIERKERDANAMFEALSKETVSILQDEVLGNRRQSNTYNPNQALQLPSFLGAAA